MFAAIAVLSILLAAALALSAARKLSHKPHVVATYTRVGVPEDKLDSLAMILLAGAGGLLLGLLWAPIGVAAAVGLVVYFILAVASHIRAGDTAHLPTPAAIEIVAAAVLGLHLANL